MAIVAVTNLGGRKTLDAQGLKFARVQLTVQATDWPNTGMPVANILASVGFKSLVDVISGVKQDDENLQTPVVFQYNPTLGVITMHTALNNTTNGTQTAAVNGDIVTLTLLGY